MSKQCNGCAGWVGVQRTSLQVFECAGWCAGWVFECAGWVLSVLNQFQNGVYITPTFRALAGVIFPVTDALQGRKSAQLKLSSCGKLLM